MYDAIYRGNLSAGNPFAYLRRKLMQDQIRDPSVLDPDIESHRNRLYRDIYAFISISETFDVYAAESCKVAALQEKGKRSMTGFAFQKNSVYASDFDLVLSRILEGQPARLVMM